MFVSIRKYQNVTSVEEVKRRVELEFVPLLQENPGFKGYYLIDCESPEAGNIVISVSIFDDWDSALASNDSAKTFVRSRLAGMQELADAIGGEVIFHASKEPL
jgi:hypothetical protein